MQKEQLNKYYVYAWFRLDKNVVFYIGKGSGNRYKDMSMRNKYFLNVVNKVGKENIKIDILVDNLSEEEAFEKEKYYISYYRKLGHPLTNISDGGEGSSGWYDKLSEEEKMKHKEISKSFLGKTHSEETKQKMRESMTGLKHNFSEEGMASLKKHVKEREPYWKGKHLSEESRKKISDARKGKPQFGSHVVVFNCDLIILEVLPSRAETYRQYVKNDRKEHNIRKCLDFNKNIKSLNDLLFDNDLSFIYLKDYDLLKTQSTIETITSSTVDVNNGVEYHDDEMSSVAI